VCQLLIGQQDQYNWSRDLLIIGVPPLERITVFDNYKDTEYLGNEIDTDTWAQQDFKISTHHGLVSLQHYGHDTQLIMYSDRSWTEMQTLRTIFLLTTWLDSKQANYMIVNLSKPLDINNTWGPSEFVLPYAMNHSRCILFKDTYHSINLDRHPPADFDRFGWNGHHGPDGNRCFFEESLLPTMQGNKLC
jgi:hypothetical protein